MNREPALYIVATPIGNLGDMVPRAVDVLQMVDLIAAEDTRHSRPLLDHFNITTRMVAYHEHSGEKAADELVAMVAAGQSVALISDAGTPLVSDPGYRLVDAALQRGVKVIPVPGSCAAIAALSVAGLPSDRFVFEGFLPAKSAARNSRLQSLAEESRTLIFYEAPHRLLDTLCDMATQFGGDRCVVLAREISKTYETIRRAPLTEMVSWVEADSNQQRGEIVLLVRGAERVSELGPEQMRIFKLLLDELPLKRAAAVAAKISGLSKSVFYQRGLELKDHS